MHRSQFLPQASNAARRSTRTIVRACLLTLSLSPLATGCKKPRPLEWRDAPQAQELVSAPACSLIGPRTERPGVYGTDLGYTVPAAGTDDRLWILFGDTWARVGDACKLPASRSDDLMAALPMRLPESLRTLPAKRDFQPCPKVLSYEAEDPEKPHTWPRIQLFEDKAAMDRGDKPLSTSTLRTPVAVFRDKSDVYAILHRNTPVECSEDASCPGGFTCSDKTEGPAVGLCERPKLAEGGSARPLCRTEEDCGGKACETRRVCLSTRPFTVKTEGGTSAPDWYEVDPRRGAALTMYVGRLVDGERGTFVVSERFATNRFTNMTARTVAHFDPDHPAKNDYRPGTHTLLIWGRPAFVGSDGAQSLPFLLYVTLPKAGEALRFEPHFFAGYRGDGRPRWTEDEEKAQPIYGTEAHFEERHGERELVWEHPEFDYVNQMTLGWLPKLDRWVMLYGGDAPDLMLAYFSEDGNVDKPVHTQPSPGAIHLRHAAHPWGGRAEREKWSAPKPVLTRKQAAPYLVCPDDEEDAARMPGCLEQGDPDGPGDRLSTLANLATELDLGTYAKTVSACLGSELVAGAQRRGSGNAIGRMYAPNIIDSWTQSLPGDEGVELFWNVSTWNPYQVILVKTRLSRTEL